MPPTLPLFWKSHLWVFRLWSLLCQLSAEHESSLKQQLRTNGGGVISLLLWGLCFPHSPSWQGSAITGIQGLWCGCYQMRWGISYGPAPTGQMSSLQSISTAIKSWGNGQDTLKHPFPKMPRTLPPATTATLSLPVDLQGLFCQGVQTDIFWSATFM